MLLYTFLAYKSIYELYTNILRSVIYFAIGLSVLVSLDRIWHVLKCGWAVGKAKLAGKEPEDAFKPGPLPDLEFEAHLYPRVAVQLPMFNERAVCQAIIDSACEMHWPQNRFMVQVASPTLFSPLYSSICCVQGRLLQSSIPFTETC
jgi:beta-mannan synthase